MQCRIECVTVIMIITTFCKFWFLVTQEHQSNFVTKLIIIIYDDDYYDNDEVLALTDMITCL